MKSTRESEHLPEDADELRPEYRFDYSEARPNRFADRVIGNQVTVTLDPDVAKVFTSSESVNRVLRALIATMPATRKKSPRA